ncbi:uncharacterized protein E0L32_005813 [Thyridium curvatum]|uniref:ATP-grasp domain-containing protein n=1 Tax=Thyridium curvatum TaxID=1093900 RepID=A0A507B8Z8_9PEZI|nr:uncharacterized protein E0L32_005813 [Thyridium curvatum]TPX13869.1 hypothetical protein E0L32_005813 [Thyridium curvatum]
MDSQYRTELPELPLITLDTTLSELYRKASPRNAHKNIIQVLCGVNSGLELNSNFPRNAKYLYQDGPFNSVPKKELTADNTELQRSLAIKYLSLIPQRDAFICGNAKVAFFNLDESSEAAKHDRQEVQATIEALDPSQRPQLVFCRGPEMIPDVDEKTDLVAYKLAVDGLQKYPLTIDLETHWFLNTKAALATSGLPTPSAKIIEITGYSPPPDTRCVHCKASEAIYIQSGCVGNRSLWVTRHKQEIIEAIGKHPLPFVVKNQQSFGGAGTYVITTEDEKRELITDFDKEVLPKLLAHVTVVNHHLNPATIIISDMVKDAIGDYGITFFVTENDDPIFLAVSQQMIDDNSAWIGSIINYQEQDELKARFVPIMRQTAAWLRKHGYYGPVGADILETAPRDGENNLNIVDLNVRTSGSLCLPLLRRHFTSRGLHCASSFSIAVEGSRADFLRRWKEDFEAGRMCILSWYEDRTAGESLADLAVGGEGEEELKQGIDKVRAMTKKVTF